MLAQWPYQGHRVLIRPVVETDLPLLHAAGSVAGFPLFAPQLSRLCPTLADRQARFALMREFDPPLEMEAIIEDPLGTPIGTMTLSALDLLNGKAELSLFLIPGEPRRAWEAWHYGIVQAFEGLFLHKLLFLVSARNTRVLRLLNRLAVPLEGCLREEILEDDGQYCDLYRYALLAGEWPESRLACFLDHSGPLARVPAPET